MAASSLEKIHGHLKKNPKETDKAYFVPEIWKTGYHSDQPIEENFNHFFTEKIGHILTNKDAKLDYNQSLSKIKNQKHGIGGDWTYTSSIYNAFPRLWTAYDHDHDGHLGADKKDITLDGNQFFRETGTLLKAIALLPYVKSLGANVIYFLPITSIGQDGNRGDLGSPYAIQNPYEIDANLADPQIPFSVEEQFKAFVEAAHILDIRVVLEFVLRTNSIGGDWVKDHPEWFYWMEKKYIKDYKNPEFPLDELGQIKQIPDGGGFHFAPNKAYRSMFKAPPKSSEIKKVKGKWVAKTTEGELVIPGAFADWPPDDIQPAWTDVTYLRMYNYPINQDADNDYNYIAYNTIRYYDPELARDENINRPLWDKLIGVIPHYQKNYGIDGVFLDMGHALPKKLLQEIIEETRKVDKDFAFIEENFEIEWTSRVAGFNGTLGFEWRTTGNTQGGIKNVMHKAGENLGLPFLGTPETHNTPRAMQRGGMMHNDQMWVFNCLLPNCIPLIHNGFELYEDYPINTGLNFTEEELTYYQGHRLGLFYKNGMNWNRVHTMIPLIQKMNELRNKYFHFIASGNEHSIYIHYPENSYGHVAAFERYDPWHPHQSILLVANTNYHHQENFYLKIPGTFNNSYIEYLSGRNYQFIDHWMSATLKPGECLVFELDKLV